MNLNRSVLVAVAMMMGSLGALGCNVTAPSSVPEQAPAAVEQPKAESAGVVADVQPAAAPAPAIQLARYDEPAVEEAPVYAPYAPPMLRTEIPGPAPGDDYVFVPGYWRWSGSQYLWIGGRWDACRHGDRYVGARWENDHGRWHFVPGRRVEGRDRDGRDRDGRDRADGDRGRPGADRGHRPDLDRAGGRPAAQPKGPQHDGHAAAQPKVAEPSHPAVQPRAPQPKPERRAAVQPRPAQPKLAEPSHPAVQPRAPQPKPERQAAVQPAPAQPKLAEPSHPAVQSKPVPQRAAAGESVKLAAHPLVPRANQAARPQRS